MKLKTTILASVSAIFLAPAANAADLPVVADPIEYVKVCDAYGAGYFQIPGKNTCMKIRGRIRTNLLSKNLSDEDIDGDEPEYKAYAKGYAWFDTMTATSWGTIKTTAGFAYQYDANAENSQLKNEDIYVQLGNDFGALLIGREQSNFDGFVGATPIAAVSQEFSDKPTLQAAFTGTLGNGLSATLAVEGSGARGGDDDEVDIVGNLKYNSGWGGLQLSAAYHKIAEFSDTYEVNTETYTVGKIEEDGYALGATVNFNVEGVGGGTKLALQVQYAQNALSYIGGPFDVFDKAATNFYNTKVDASGFDALGFSGWSVGGGFTQNLSDTVSLIVDASYASIEGSNSVSAGTDTFKYDVDATRFGVDGAVVFELAPDLIWAVNAGWGRTELEASETVVGGATTSGSDEYTETRVGTRVQYTF